MAWGVFSFALDGAEVRKLQKSWLKKACGECWGGLLALSLAITHLTSILFTNSTACPFFETRTILQ
jgi:hypothetical protein